MATAANKPNDCSLCSKLGLKPLTKDNLLFYYIPIHSVATYGALSVSVTNPALISKVLPKADLTNLLLSHTVVGSSLYIYSRPHLKAIPQGKRIAYSVLGGGLFSLGSILTWAIARNLVPSKCVATILGLVSGGVMVKLGYDYLNDCDKQVKN